jgi:hypothetical protein
LGIGILPCPHGSKKTLFAGGKNEGVETFEKRL